MSTQKEWQALNNEIIACRRCPRLTEWREKMAAEKRKAYMSWNYWGKPVPGFGDLNARVLVVGLAPGAHGSNRTGRMFTGDASGEFLYQALFEAGFSTQPQSRSNDDPLQLKDIFISAVCRCAPPANKPTSEEIDTCVSYLEREFDLLFPVDGIVALGRIAFDTLLRIKYNRARFRFSHGAFFNPDGYPWFLASYHPSRQNTQTGRLTVNMFAEIWRSVRTQLEIKE
jgi:uracil-DNA glycosylase family 4